MNSLLPLIRKGKQKKALFISSAMGDADFSVQADIYEQGSYSISKAALNMAVAKYHAKHKDEGILVMAISPGVVDSGNPFFTTCMSCLCTAFVQLLTFWYLAEEERARMGNMVGKFQKYAPNWKGPISVEESVKLCLGVVDNATFERNGGQMVSHLGTKQWI